jgi:cytidylate kinase
MGYGYIESGLVYRAITMTLLWAELTPDSSELLMRRTLSFTDVEIQDGRVLVNHVDVTEPVMDTEIGRVTPLFNALPFIQETAINALRDMVGNTNAGVVMAGRSIGSVVFPNAEVKFYLDATESARAQRRFAELVQQGVGIDLQTVLADVARRDRQDSEREAAPLIVPEGAIYIDTTELSLQEVLGRMVTGVRSVL